MDALEELIEKLKQLKAERERKTCSREAIIRAAEDRMILQMAERIQRERHSTTD